MEESRTAAPLPEFSCWLEDMKQKVTTAGVNSPDPLVPLIIRHWYHWYHSSSNYMLHQAHQTSTHLQEARDNAAPRDLGDFRMRGVDEVEQR